MSETLFPLSDKECAERIKDALQTKTTVAVIGKGTRSGTADAVKISASRMTDVAFFHPEDMVIGVKAGIEVGTLKKLLAEAKMELEIDAHRDDTTIGSAVAMNDTGASRLFGGGVRDKIIGIEYIDGFGDIVKGGGKVVKNVAGYDTPKMMTGSRGGLGMITQVNFKILPAPAYKKQMILHTDSSSRVAEVLYKLNTRFTPLSALAVKDDGNSYSLAAGYAGNSAKIKRLEQELTDIAGADAVFEDMDPLKEFIYMPVKLASEWFAGKGLHLQIFGQTSLLSGQNFMQSLRALGCRALYHPFGGDVHLFHPADEKKSQQEKSAQLLALFPGPVRHFQFHTPVNLFSYQTFSPLPGEFELAKLLKRTLDPAGIYHSPFYRLI